MNISTVRLRDLRRRSVRLVAASWALVKIGWWLLEAIVALPLLPLYWLCRLAQGKPVLYDLPVDVVTPRQMDALKPEIAKENQAAFRLYWRSAIYHELVLKYGATSERAYAAATEAADQVECTITRT